MPIGGASRRAHRFYLNPRLWFDGKIEGVVRGMSEGNLWERDLA